MARRILIGLLMVIATGLVVTFDHVWIERDLVDLLRWMIGALLVAAVLFAWSLVQLVKMLRSSNEVRTMDSFFWIVFLILPTSLGGIIWIVASLIMLADLL